MSNPADAIPTGQPQSQEGTSRRDVDQLLDIHSTIDRRGKVKALITAEDATNIGVYTVDVYENQTLGATRTKTAIKAYTVRPDDRYVVNDFLEGYMHPMGVFLIDPDPISYLWMTVAYDSTKPNLLVGRVTDPRKFVPTSSVTVKLDLTPQLTNPSRSAMPFDTIAPFYRYRRPLPTTDTLANRRIGVLLNTNIVNGTGLYKVLTLLDALDPGTMGWDYPRFGV